MPRLTNRLRSGLVVAAALCALAAGGCKRNAGWKPASGEYPERRLDATTFPHSSHKDVDCTDCHQGIAAAPKLGQVRLPAAEKCKECHDPLDAVHTPPATPARTEYAFRFSHADHLEKLKGEKNACARCHTVLPEPGEKRKLTPPMATCTSCHHHEVEVAEARCRPCHDSLKAFGLKPIEQFTEFSHGANFIREHGKLAGTSAETCAQCHDQTYCATCHANATLPVRPEIRFPENVTSSFIHRGQYVSQHQFDAQRDPASCRKCHGSFFCESCHEQQFRRPGSLGNPHPQGWATPGSPRFHGDAARANIVSCAGCHDQPAPTNLCAQCHRQGGVASRSPHPAGWSRKHGRDDIPKNAACRACHSS